MKSGDEFVELVNKRNAYLYLWQLFMLPVLELDTLDILIMQAAIYN